LRRSGKLSRHDKGTAIVTIAVLGASGFVGGHIARVLRVHGHAVRAVVRKPGYLAIDGSARIADALDVYALRDALAGCDCAVHSILGSPDVIVGSMAPVYAAAQAVGVKRLVYISTGSVYGQSPKPGTDETTPLSVRHAFAYNTAKVRAERSLMRLRSRGTVEVVVLRPTIVFGPGSRWVFDFADGLRDGSAYLVEGARGICNSIYVDNLGYAVHLAVTTPGIDREIFLVGDEESVTWRDLYRPIAEAFGRDLDLVPSVAAPKDRAGAKELYLAPLLSSELGRAVVPYVPALLKDTLRRCVRLARATRGRPAPGAGAGPRHGPCVTAEMAALHRCRWKLPHDKAKRMLGYAPPVPFAEGCRRSVGWLLARAETS
jgi:2-alkyl-3-oxoalkanoate reductase